jgi:hypothetical protein
MAEMDDDDILDALGVEATPVRNSTHTAEEERILAGFEEILRFHQTHGRAPRHGGEGADIFERIYAVRLDQIRKLPQAHPLLAGLDTVGLLKAGPGPASSLDALDEDALLAELGVGPDSEKAEDDITVLRHVRSAAEIKLAEEIADRTRCLDFDKFKDRFEQVERDLKAGKRVSMRFGRDASIAEGNYFILGGNLALVAQMGDTIRAPNGEFDARLRVIYSNGTESNLLRRSLQRALYKDESGRRVSDPDMGPLFGDESDTDDIASGSIYVLRSKSTHPFVEAHRELIHKIGMTGGKVETRIAGAENDATYMLAQVDVVATYKLHNINRTKLENVFHRLFAGVQLSLTIEDRFGKTIRPREWFLVPLHVIDEAVERIRDGSITDYAYDPTTARLEHGGHETS